MSPTSRTRLRATGLSLSKRGYVSLTRAVSRRLTLDAAGDHRGGGRERWRHWLASLPRVHDSLALAELDVPWWTYDAIDVVDRWIGEHPGPVRVYEYGSGASTLWLARRVGEVHSVEHHEGFGAMMRDHLGDHPNVDLRVVPPTSSTHPVVASGKEGTDGLDFADYVASIDLAPGSFDLVVVDGRAREACLAAALPRLAPDGIVVFDNSRRRRYRSAIEGSGLHESRFGGLTPTLPYPEQTSVLRQGGR